MKWEYRVALFRWRSDVWQEVNNMTDELNRLGHEGWEVAGLSYAEFSGQIVILKRPAVISCRPGSPTTTRFTRTRLSDIVPRVSSL
jgi:hypothetical protein